MPFRITDFNERQQRQIRDQLAGNAVRSMEANKPKQAFAQALVRGDEKLKGGKVGVVISLIGLLKRTLDCDNFCGACKPLRDGIASSLGIDDGDKRIRWQYNQCETRGQEGVIVHIEVK
jgi:hypothetical protein